MLTEKELKDLMWSMFRSREQIIVELLKAFDDQATTERGCHRVDKEWNIYKGDRNLETQLHTAIRINERQAKLLQKLILINLLYVMGNNSQSDAAHVLNKLGDGNEVLQEMFKQKLRGE